MGVQGRTYTSTYVCQGAQMAKIGEGNIRFWFDNWVGSTLFKKKYEKSISSIQDIIILRVMDVKDTNTNYCNVDALQSLVSK